MQLVWPETARSTGLAVLSLCRPTSDKQVNLCQTWGVVSNGGGDNLVGQVARELNECRIRGIDRLDVDNRRQHLVMAQELGLLAAQFAAAQPTQVSGRSAQIKALLRTAIKELRESNPTDARLIGDLFFRDERSAYTASDLLKRAQQRYGEPSEDRFREIRNIALRNFAAFLIEFVSRPASLTASVTSLPARDHSLSIHGVSEEPVTTDRRRVPSPFAAVLRFSLVDPGVSGKLTIEEHQKIIAERGMCWWGWFKSTEDADYSAEIGQRIENCEIGLWERSESLFYLAHCDGAVTAHGDLVESPDAELTPDYYRAQPYPAWFRLRSIRRSSRQEFEERFGYLPNTPPTILWRSGTLPQPINVQARGSAILHISDLRFGQHHRWNTANVPNRTHMTTEQAIVQTLLMHGIDLTSVGVVVICGNFVSDNPSSEAYHEALAFIDNLCAQLQGVSRDHVVVVPGADDFARPGDRERSGQELYRKFHQSLYGSEDQDISPIRRYEFEMFRLNVLPVNSVKMLGTDEEDDGLFGYGYDGQLHVMRDDYLRNHGNNRVINVIATHHHIMPTTVKLPETANQKPVDARVMLGMYDSLDIRTKLSASRVALYLHGHLHEPDCYAIVSDGWQTGISGAGTAGASDRWLRSRYRDNHGNSLALISIADDTIHGSIFVYNEDLSSSSSPFKKFHIKDQY